MIAKDQLELYGLVLFVLLGIVVMLWTLAHLVLESRRTPGSSAQPLRGERLHR